jgi:hypothetical protein
MNWQEIILYTFWFIVYLLAGKLVVDDLYIGNTKVKGLLWIFWCPFIIAIMIWWAIEEFIGSLKGKTR